MKTKVLSSFQLPFLFSINVFIFKVPQMRLVVFSCYKFMHLFRLICVFLIPKIHYQFVDRRRRSGNVLAERKKSDVSGSCMSSLSKNNVHPSPKHVQQGQNGINPKT